MNEVIGRAGVRVPRQCWASDLAQAISWFEQECSIVVVKPVDSAGSDNVFICRTVDQVKFAFGSILGSMNLMMRPNDTVLLQELLEGPEFAVNSVSHNGEHWITDIWQYTKRHVDAGQRKIYDREDLIDPSCPECDQLVTYVKSVLDALGIAFGPAHTEVIITASGPLILETGARISGSVNPKIVKAATGTDQTETTVWSYLEPEKLHQLPKIYRRQQSATCVDLIVTSPGILNCARIDSRLQLLPTLSDFRYRVSDGSSLEPTTDLSSSPGTFFLIDESQNLVDADYTRFRQWEMELYNE